MGYWYFKVNFQGKLLKIMTNLLQFYLVHGSDKIKLLLQYFKCILKKLYNLNSLNLK